MTTNLPNDPKVCPTCGVRMALYNGKLICPMGLAEKLAHQAARNAK